MFLTCSDTLVFRPRYFGSRRISGTSFLAVAPGSGCDLDRLRMISKIGRSLVVTP